MTALAEMAVKCMEFRSKIPPRLRAEFGLIEEAALKWAIDQDIEPAFRCHVDESAGLAEVFDIREKRG